MTLFLRWGPGERAALVASFVAASVLATAAWDAWRLEAPPPPAAADPLTLPPLPNVRDDAPTYASVDQAVEGDPFRPERVPAATRYRLPGETEETPPAVAVAPPPPPVRLEGLVTTAGGGFAALGVAGAPARLVRVGDSVGGLRVARIAAGAVTLSGADTTFVVRLRAPGAPAEVRAGGTAAPPAARPVRMVRQISQPQ